MQQTKNVEYEVWVWEEDCSLTLHLNTLDYGQVVSTCEHLSTVGVEYEVYKKTTELLDI